MNNIRIMVVEDDITLAKQIQTFLSKWDFDAVLAMNFKDIMKDFEDIKPHLILLDINLPYYDGFHWCNKIRNVSKVPIIFISSRNDDRDKIMAITQGGDDYIEKPFQLAFLRAKIEAMLRRTYQYKMEQRIALKTDVYYESSTSCILVNDQRLELTKSENTVLKVLSEHRPSIVSRNDLMDALWSTDEFISDNTLTVLISRLRTKLKDYCQDEIIQTKKGQGYYIK